jgi:hypothetical protein
MGKILAHAVIINHVLLPFFINNGAIKLENAMPMNEEAFMKENFHQFRPSYSKSKLDFNSLKSML